LEIGNSISRKFSVITVLGLLLVLGLNTFGEVSPALAAEGFANEAFQTAWQQVDGPVAAGQSARPYIWGQPGGAVLQENYKEAKGGKRQVQYFAKGRMELTRPELQPGFVGDGRLVLEMISGRVQIADNSYLQFDGCESPVAGANTFARNPGAPSYRAFQSLVAARPSQVGQAVRLVLTNPEAEGFFLRYASLNPDNALGTLSKYAVYIPESGHNVPDVFWNYLNQPDSSGLPLFNWQNLFGLPLTDAYWSKVRGADGTLQDILVQLFERRTLLYNPAAANGFQVESGDVGTDYYRWRYQLPELPVVETQTEQGSLGNATAQPAFGEGGTTFIIAGSNFKPGEKTSAWVEQQELAAGPEAGRGIFELNVPINNKGQFRLRQRTQPFLTPSFLERFVVIGLESGNKVVINLRIIGSIRYTPAVEASQPSDVPASKSATLQDKIIQVGDASKVVASGFLPGENLQAWLTTPLNRVVSWRGLIINTSSYGEFNRLLRADSSGQWTSDVPGPGAPVPGIYALTVYGTQSGNTAIVYFRTRTNTLLNYDPTWGAPDPNGPAAARPRIDLSKLPLNPALQVSPAKLQFELIDDALVGEE